MESGGDGGHLEANIVGTLLAPRLKGYLAKRSRIRGSIITWKPAHWRSQDMAVYTQSLTRSCTYTILRPQRGPDPSSINMISSLQRCCTDGSVELARRNPRSRNTSKTSGRRTPVELLEEDALRWGQLGPSSPKPAHAFRRKSSRVDRLIRVHRA